MATYYYDDLANVQSKLCMSCRLLLRWQGSVYKLLWKHILFYFVSYIALGLLYKYILDEDAKRIYERVALSCAKYADSLPVVLMLGFFTGSIMQRWWAVYAAIPGTGKIITMATFYMKKNNPQASAHVRTLVRFVLLGWLLCMRQVCLPLRKKYPTWESLQQKGLLLEHERDILERVENERHSKVGFQKGSSQNDGSKKISIYPLNWSMLLIREAKDRSYFESAADSAKVLEAVMALKKSCSTILKFEITNIPLSFIQAVTITVHSFGIVSLMGRQFVDFPNKLLVLDCYMPFLPALQYLAYLSWLKLAEVAVNPFGDDDDDFDVVSLFKKHKKTAEELLRLFERNEENPVDQSVLNVDQTKFAVSPPLNENKLGLKFIERKTNDEQGASSALRKRGGAYNRQLGTDEDESSSEILPLQK